MEPYGVDDTRGSRVHSEHNATSYNPIEDVDLSAKRDTLSGVNPGVPDPIANNERSISKSNYDALPVSAAESNILFVGGLPKDCTRREVGRILCHLYVCLYALVYLFFYFQVWIIMYRKKLFSNFKFCRNFSFY
jgi:hypothetical protein